MFVDYREIKTVSLPDQKAILKSCKKTKHRAIITLMLDAGLRVTEAVRLQWKDVRFADTTIHVKSLKKRGKDKTRVIPMTSRLLEVLSEWYTECKSREEGEFLFPSKTTKTGHMSRKSVWHMIKRYSVGKAYPHMLRHTFATQVVNKGGDLLAAKELLGHSSVQTTEIYTHATLEAKKSTINLLEPTGIIALLQKHFKPTKKVFKIQRYSDYSSFHVGRKNEIKLIESHSNRKINTLLLGKQGIGKSHLLSRLTGDHIIRLDDMSSIKQSLGELLLQLHNGKKEAVINALTNEAKLSNVISKSSVKRLTDLLCKVTQPQEYTLIIDDLTSVTKQGVQVLEQLKNHFHIVGAARQLSLTKASFLTNFEKLRIEGLSRPEIASLVGHHSREIYSKIEDWNLYVNHIWEHSDGNPLFAIELCKRFEKEPLLDVYTIRNISHTDAVKEIDVSAFIVIGLSSLMVLRYIGGEFGTDQSGAFRLFGGVFFVVAIFARSLFTAAKRKTV